jgi:cytidine deaminase
MTPDALIAKAAEVRKKAHAPYSKYLVGAALLAKDGRVFTGCNVENASYGLTSCAERNAIFSAVAAGAKKFTAVAVVTENGGSPCGACRQVLREFGTSILVIMANPRGKAVAATLDDLLPGAFGPEHLR